MSSIPPPSVPVTNPLAAQGPANTAGATAAPKVPVTKIASHHVLPKDARSWQIMATDHHVQDVSLHHVESYKPASGSSISFEQFLLCRTVWDSRPANDTTLKQYLPQPELFEQAEKLLLKSPDWNYYAQRLSKTQYQRTGDSWTPKLGIFGDTFLLQQDINSTDGQNKFSLLKVSPRKTRDRNPTIVYAEYFSEEGDNAEHAAVEQDPDYVEQQKLKAAKDEAIVNSALALLLDALVRLPRASNPNLEALARINLERKRLRFGKSWTADVDGFAAVFGRGNDDDIYAILEVKAMQRNRLESPIRAQETAEMVCWIYDARFQNAVYEVLSTNQIPPGKQVQQQKQKTSTGTAGIAEAQVERKTYRRLLLSQDREQLYFIIGEYTDGYINYLRNEGDPQIGAKPDLLSMLQIGPFIMSRNDHMLIYATFWLAYTMHFSGHKDLPSGGPQSGTNVSDADVFAPGTGAKQSFRSKFTSRFRSNPSADTQTPIASENPDQHPPPDTPIPQRIRQSTNTTAQDGDSNVAGRKNKVNIFKREVVTSDDEADGEDDDIDHYEYGDEFGDYSEDYDAPISNGVEDYSGDPGFGYYQCSDEYTNWSEHDHGDYVDDFSTLTIDDREHHGYQQQIPHVHVHQADGIDSHGGEDYYQHDYDIYDNQEDTAYHGHQGNHYSPADNSNNFQDQDYHDEELNRGWDQDSKPDNILSSSADKDFHTR